MMEFGIDYFHPINKKENLYFQLYVGAGLDKTGIKESGQISINFLIIEQMKAHYGCTYLKSGHWKSLFLQEQVI